MSQLIRPPAELDPALVDRVEKALLFQEGDRVPIWDYIDNSKIVTHFADEGDDAETAMVKVYHGLGIDMCRGYGEAFETQQEGSLGYNDDGDVSSKVTGQSRWKVKREIQCLEDLRMFEPDVPTREKIYDVIVPEHRRLLERFAPHTMFIPGGGCGFHSCYDLMGLELFSIALYDARADLERILGKIRDACIATAMAFAEAKLGPIYFIGDDIAYKNTTIFSPKLLRELFIPCLEGCIRPCKEAGLQVIYHSDGDVMGILDDMIAAGIDGLNPIEPIAGMDIGLLKQRYRNRLVLVGNLDCSQLLPLGSVEEVREGTRELLRTASPGGGHLIGSSSEITPTTPVENIIAFCETVHEDGRYPIQC